MVSGKARLNEGRKGCILDCSSFLVHSVISLFWQFGLKIEMKINFKIKSSCFGSKNFYSTKKFSSSLIANENCINWIIIQFASLPFVLFTIQYLIKVAVLMFHLCFAWIVLWAKVFQSSNSSTLASCRFLTRKCTILFAQLKTKWRRIYHENLRKRLHA